MSLGDRLRLLRAQRGGLSPAEIEEALPDLPKGLYRFMEQRYRAVGDDAAIAMIAGYYGVPSEDLRWRLEWPRKALSRALVHALKLGAPMTLHLTTGRTIRGKVAWWDLGAAGIVTHDGEVVVQRHAVERWDPRAPEVADEAEDEEGERSD